jgi:hypothetical protein
MTETPSAAGLPLAATVAGDLIGDDENQGGGGPTVGASDRDADAARTGADVDLENANRDSDGVPVGAADAAADAETD